MLLVEDKAGRQFTVTEHVEHRIVGAFGFERHTRWLDADVKELMELERNKLRIVREVQTDPA